MAKRSEKQVREGGGEKLSRWGRNINLLGAVAIGGAAILIPGPNVILSSWAALNALQAGGFEWVRRIAEKRSKKTNK